MAVASVDEYIARLQKRQKLADKFIHGVSGTHHHHDFAGYRKRFYQLFRAVRPDQVFIPPPAVHETFDYAFFHAGYGAIVYRHAKALAFHVQREVFTHYCQTDEPNVSWIFHIMVLY